MERKRFLNHKAANNWPMKPGGRESEEAVHNRDGGGGEEEEVGDEATLSAIVGSYW